MSASVTKKMSITGGGGSSRGKVAKGRGASTDKAARRDGNQVPRNWAQGATMGGDLL